MSAPGSPTVRQPYNEQKAANWPNMLRYCHRSELAAYTAGKVIVPVKFHVLDQNGSGVSAGVNLSALHNIRRGIG